MKGFEKIEIIKKVRNFKFFKKTFFFKKNFLFIAFFSFLFSIHDSFSKDISKIYKITTPQNLKKTFLYENGFKNTFQDKEKNLFYPSKFLACQFHENKDLLEKDLLEKLKKIDLKIKNMSLDEKIGQIFFCFFFGKILDERAKKFIEDTKIGNFIYFNWANSLSSKKQIKILSFDLKKEVFEKVDIFPFIAIDQEGGPVRRLKEENGFSRMASFKKIANDKNLSKNCYSIWKKISYEMKEVGINTNLAPVVDMNEKNLRSFGGSSSTAIKFSKIFIKAMKKNNIFVVLKHFPGLGISEKDPHLELCVIEKDKKEVFKNIKPFIFLKEETDAIMTTHITAKAFDSKNPATFSKILLKDILRKKIGFEKLIIADSLTMKGAIEEEGNLKKQKELIKKSCIKAFLAGCDLIILSRLEEKDVSQKDKNNMSEKEKEENYEMMKECVLAFKEAVLTGKISEKRLNRSLRRIFILKENLAR